MAINFNTGPYFDDFDPNNNFYRVLFKPGYAIQARELNQLQSILQHQVSSVGKHLFKKNAMVIPGGIVLNSTADILTITGVADPTTLIGKTITDKAYTDYTNDAEFDGFNTAVVLSAEIISQENQTTTSALYIKYFKTGSTNSTFQTNNTLYTVEQTPVTFQTSTSTASTVGKVAIINPGTFFTKNVFVDVERQFLIVEIDNSKVTNCIVGLNIVESIVTANDDSTLLDNSNGYPNQYAPGADRYKIDLVLTKLDSTTEIDDDIFIKMMEIENDSIVYLNNRTEYAELMTTLARRTYDANGNFIVKGFDLSITPTSADDFVWANINRGKCYLGGYEYERIVNTPLALEKPRSSAYQENMPAVTKYITDIPYMYVAGATGLRNLPSPNTVVEFTNATPDASGASIIGFGVFRDAQYVFGDTTSVYKFRFDVISLDSGKTLIDIGGLKAPSAAANYGLQVLHELTLANINGSFSAGSGVGNANAGATGSTVAGATGVIYYASGNKIYVRKTTTNPVPNSSVITAGSSTTANVVTQFVSNYTPTYVPMVEVDKDVVKSVDNVATSNLLRCTINPILPGNNALPTLSGSSYAPASATNYFGFINTSGAQQFIDLTSNGWSVSPSGAGCNILATGGATAFHGKSMDVYYTTTTSSVPLASKTYTNATFTIPVSNANWTALGHQEIVNIDKIVEGKTLAVATASWSGGTVTVTTKDAHGLASGNTVVVRGITSSGSTGITASLSGVSSIDFANTPSYNGQFSVTITGATGFTYSVSSDPGTAIATNGTVAVPPNINSDTDVTARYDLYSGSGSHFVGTGMIKIKPGVVVPKGQLAVKYNYDSYSGSGTTRYVAANSYTAAFPNTTGVQHIAKIANINDDLGNTIETRRYIDYRTRTSDTFFLNKCIVYSWLNYAFVWNLNLSGATGLIGQYIVGKKYPSGTQITGLVTGINDERGLTILKLGATGAGSGAMGNYFIGTNSSFSVAGATGAQTFDLPKDSATYTYTKFKPRELMVYVDRQEDSLSIKQLDIPSISEISKYRRDPFKLPLAHVYMKPYTMTPDDVTVTKFENPVYQMLDIYNIDKRVERNEYYTSLSLSGDNVGDLASVTSGFGFWNENFADTTKQDVQSNDYSCTIYSNAYAAPSTTTRTINLELAKDSTTNQYYNSTTFTQTGSALTLPYTESRAFGNDRASNSNNLNPYNTIQWNGTLKLYPAVDNLSDTGNQVAPQPPVDETVIEITNFKNFQGSGGSGCGSHGIYFDWKTNLGKTGRVNTDLHISSVIKQLGKKALDKNYATSMINRKYNDPEVKQFLNAGREYDSTTPYDLGKKNGTWN